LNWSHANYRLKEIYFAELLLFPVGS